MNPGSIRELAKVMREQRIAQVKLGPKGNIRELTLMPAALSLATQEEEEAKSRGGKSSSMTKSAARGQAAPEAAPEKINGQKMDPKIMFAHVEGEDDAFDDQR